MGEQELFAAFVAGWKASGEGHNGEVPLTEDVERLTEMLRESFTAWLRSGAEAPALVF